MNIHKSYQPLNKNDIQEIESALNVILPNEYADFLLNTHAYQIHTAFFEVGEREFYFSNFLPYVNEKDVRHLVSFNLHLRECFPGYLLIARGHSHDAYLLKHSGKEYGHIYYLRLDNTLEEGRFLIASSFNTFCELLDKYEGHESKY